ncbi:hypothetical protein HELRODRAFT_163252 [Helobdella robusta]|uniref:G-protein coupled receptors family 1 profile domain-containing protein n=1 Tax=Helobdella robusta TaxID=6412 RepID=T1ETU4_HELRO|nr:hypothetical protein HELRODRAFT_163252 [Helobdella robusta]ESN96212.1 hypothetical protein HELRODRAFT_163252 [Helobdella robusta]
MARGKRVRASPRSLSARSLYSTVSSFERASETNLICHLVADMKSCSNLTSNLTSQNATNDITAIALRASQNFKIINTLVGIFGFLLNGFVVIALLFGGKKNKGSASNQLSSSNFHVCCQSAVDSFVGLVLFFTTIFEDDGQPRYSSANFGHQILCRFWLSKCFLWAGFSCSTYCVLSLNFERYVAIVHPIFHRTKFSRNRIYSILSLSVAFLIGGGFMFCYIPAAATVLPDGRCTTYSVFPSEFARQFMGFMTFFVEFFTPLIVIIVFYTRMVLVLHRRVAPKHDADEKEADDEQVIDNKETNAEKTTNMKSNHDEQISNNNESRSKIAIISSPNQLMDQTKQKHNSEINKKPKKDKPKSSMERARDSVFKTSALISLSFVVCWSWNQIYYFMFQLGVPGCNLTGPFYDFTVFMIFVNCIAYPIIFLVKYEPVQKNVKHLLSEIKQKLLKSK